MTKALGHDFILVNDVRQRFKDSAGTEWFHLATVKRGVKEYVAFKRLASKHCYIEEITSTGTFIQIEDDNEFNDLYQFLLMNGCLVIADLNKEIKLVVNES